MKLIIPQAGFSMKTESDRIIIESNPLAKRDRALSRKEVSRRLNKGLRMIDHYRRVPGEARLRSESIDGRIVIWESDFIHWLSKKGNNLHNSNGGFSSIRPGKERGSSVEGLGRNLPGITLT